LVRIIPYNGFGNPYRLYLKGRVLEDQGIPPAMDNDSLWENILNMYKRMESDEVPHARLVARFEGQEQLITCDEEGYFEVDLKLTEPLPVDRLWHTVELELLDPIPTKQTEPVRARGEVLVPPASAEYMVISDVDDTVVKTDATHLLRMARTVFLGNAHTRLPFPGVAAFYRALYKGSSGENWNPLFYVSGSPWNLYDLLVDFFHLQNIPVGPVLALRDWGLTENEVLPIHNEKFKLATIRRMLDFYPNLPVLLVGDSGQEDPEIYSQIVREYPKRILAVYIRNVSRDLRRADSIRQLAKKAIDAGSDLILAENTVAIAEHAVQKGWIRAGELPEIIGEKSKDEAPPTPIEKLLNKDQEEAPTTVLPAATGHQEAKAKEAIDKGALEDAAKEVGDTPKEKPPTIIIDTNVDPDKGSKK
jgi:phosphatidate phosphatase APP1